MSASRAHNAELEFAHKHSTDHRQELLKSDLCGCFYCLETFPPREIKDWVDVRAEIGMTARCPHCGIDSVIGSESPLPLTPQFLQQMHDYWFG